MWLPIKSVLIIALTLPEDEYPISASDKEALKPQLVPAMIALSAQNEKPIRAQIAECVSLIAELDFPHRWPDLIDVRSPFLVSYAPHFSPHPSYLQQLVQSLTTADFNVNIGVLETAHSIFRSWRSQARSDAFWSIIKLVHSKFLVPYFNLFELTISRLLPSPDRLLAQTMLVLVELFYDLTCQDLAPEFEDGHEIFFAADTGYFMRLMEWNPPQLQTDVCIPCTSPVPCRGQNRTSSRMNPRPRFLPQFAQPSSRLPRYLLLLL
jgi:exportin-2 (importin alpha re-exporter)